MPLFDFYGSDIQSEEEKHALQPISPDVPQGQALDGSSAQLRERTEEGIDDTPIPRVKLQHKYNKPEQQGTINPYGEGGLTGRQLSNLRRSFSEDPLLCVENDEAREKIESIAATFGVEDGERIKKAVALAHYYSMGHREKAGFIFDNLDVAIELFEGKKMTVDQAFESVKNLYEPQQEGIWGNRWLAAATAGGAEVDKTAANAASFIGRRLTESGQIVAITGAGLYSGLLRLIGAEGKAARVLESAKDSLLSRDYGKEWEDAVQKELAKPIETVETWAQQNMKVPENWVTNSDNLADLVENAGLSLLNYLPQLGAQLTLMTATGGVSSLGLVYGINGYYDIKGDLPEISEEKALLYGLGIGLINSALENVSLGIIEGKVAEHFASNGIKKGLTRILEYLGASALMEGSEEALEEFSENMLDIYMGRRGDTKDWTSKDWTDNLFRGMPEAFFLGFTTGFGMAGLNVKPLREKAELNQKVRNYAEKRKSDLDAKETLTNDEEMEYNVLSAALDSNDPNRVLHAANVVSLNAKLRQQQEQNAAQKRYNEAEERFSKAQEELDAISARPTQDAKNRNTAVTKYRAAKAELDAAKADLDAARKDFVKAFPEEETIEERAIREAEEVRIVRDLKRRIGWNPQDTIDTVNQIAQQYQAIPIHAVLTFDDLPENAKEEARRRGIDKGNVDAVWCDNEVYVVADKLRPGMVGKKILHEVVGHAGLRRVFGDQYNNFLDDVYAQHSAEIEEKGLAKLYNTKPDTVEGRRYLADEFLAKLAESDVKPSWWKELLAQIRTYLRNMFPGIHFSDADIEVALVRSARAMRREQELSDVAPESRFALGGEMGASRLNNQNYNIAIEMEEAGKDAKTIWLATGWERGKDGKWRFELPDMKVKLNILNTEELNEKQGWYLWDFAEGRELFEAYPELKDVIVRIENLSPLTKGHYDPEFNEIVLNRFGLIDDSITVLKWREDDVAASKAENTTDANEQLSAIRNGLARIINDTLVHEVQHAIQEIEGFAKGTNVNAAGYLNHETDDPVYAIKEKQEQLINQDIQEMMSFAEEKLHVSRVFLNDFFQDAWGIIADYAGKQNQGNFKKDFDEFLDRYAPEADAEARDEAYDAAYRLLRKQDYFQRLQASMSADQTYKRFAGEVEGRNIQKRAEMSEEERRNRPPSYTEDVHRAYQIVRFSVAETGEDVRFSIRQEPPPKKTLKGYKVFAVFKNKPGLYPPMVANPGGEATPVAVWLNADAAPRAEDSKTGRPRVQAGGKGTNTGKQTLAFRPGWHLGEVPVANQFMRTNPETGEKDLFPDNFVWAECEIAADVDYQEEAMSYGKKENGKFQHSLAGLPRVPKDGFYRYRTNPDPNTDPWLITGAMKVTRLLDDADVEAILKENGREPYKRQGGPIDLSAFGLKKGDTRFSVSDGVEQTETPEFKNWFKDSKVVDEDGKPLVVYHGTRGIFYAFDPEKTGSNLDFGTMGKGFYFTSDRENAENIARNNINEKDDPIVLSVYLSLQNPKRIPWNQLSGDNKTAAEKFSQKWESKGYDGFVAVAPNGATWYVAFRPEQIKSATENVGTFDPNNPDVRYSVSPVWTGSAADYEQPDLNFVGTGEGAQVYGWGLYGSAERGVGEWYAKTDVRRKGKRRSPYQYARDKVRESVTMKGGRVLDEAHTPKFSGFFTRDVEGASEVEEVWGDIVYELDDWVEVQYRNGFSGTISAEQLRVAAIRKIQWQIDAWSNFSTNETYKENYERYKKDLSYLLDEDKKGELEFHDIEIEQDKGRNLYRQTFWPNKEENLLDWDLSIEPEQAKKILSQMEKEKLFDNIPKDEDDALAERLIYLQKFLGYAADGQSNISGQTVYETLANIFETEDDNPFGPPTGPKAASEFLYRAGIDGVTYIGHESGARNYVAFSDKDIQVEEHIRFSLENYSEEDKQQLVTLLKPKWIEEAFVEPSEVKAFLESVGETDVDENDAWALYHMAGSEIRAEKKKADDKKRDNWIYENDLLYHDAVDYGGLDFKIIPSLRFLDNDEWPGTFIADSWRKRGKKRPQGKNESGLRYHEYLRRREAELTSEHQTGITSDDLAKYIARIRGGDELDIEEQIIEHFRYLNRPKLWDQYYSYKKEQNYRNKIEQNAAEEEFAEYKREQIKKTVEEIIANKGQITEEWAIANPDVFKELYRQLMNEEPPKSRKPSKENLEAINARLANEDVNAAAYKAARKAAWAEFQKKLTALRQEMNDKNANAVKLQREAAAFAEENLPPELRGMFTRGIIKLLDYGTSPSKNFPEGRRMHEFYQLQDEILKASQTKRTEDSIGHIREMLDAVKMKRNWKGIPVSVIPSEQARVERIRKIIDMSAASVANAIEYNNSRILELEAGVDAEYDEKIKNGEDFVFPDIEHLKQKYIEDNALLELFGNLEYRKPDSVLKAEDFLQDLIKGGKAKFKSLLAQQAGRVMVMRQQAVSEITGGKNVTTTGGAVESKDAKNHTPYILKNMHLGSLLRLVAAKAGIDFDSTVAGKLWISTEKSTQKEMTAHRHLQEDFDAVLNDILGTSGQGKIAQMRMKGRFLKSLSKVEQKTGVFKTQFSRQKVIDPLDAPIVQVGRSSSKIHLIPVEDYTRRVQNEDGTFEEIKCPGVRSILRAIDNGGAYEIGDGVNLDETGVWMLRKQLEDYDAGIDRRLDFFVDEIDKESAKKLEADSEKDKLAVIFRGKNVESKQVEVPLSQGTALQILLTWEQEDYRANMKWNGWTEDSIEQIKKFLKPETLRLGYWMRDYFAKQRGELDEAVVKRYGAHLPENQNYWPGRFSGSRTSIGTGGMRGAGTMNINPSFLIARKFHLNPLDMDVDAFSVFFDGQIKQNHFLAWTDTIRDMREVFGDTSVQDAINENFGKDVTKNLVERIVTIAQGGRENNGFLSSFFSHLNRYWIPAKIALNPSSFIKQRFATLSYMNFMPVDEYVKYMSRANMSNMDYKAFVQMALNSDYLKNRWAGGLDKDLIYMMQNTRDTAPYSPLAESLLSVATYMTKHSDRWSALHGGFAVYQYNLDQARKSGLSEKEAQERARRAWMRATDSSQQSGYLKDLNYYQQNQGLVRFYTAFLTSPIQVMNLQLQTLNDIKYNSDNAAAKKKLAKQIFVNHVVVMTLMQFTTDMVRAGLNPGDWWDNAEFEDYFTAWLFGPFEGLFFVGKEAKSAINLIADKIFGRKNKMAQQTSAVQLATETTQNFNRVWNDLKDEEITAKDIADGMSFAGDLGMLYGATPAPGAAAVGSTGAVVNAGGTLAKRILKAVEDDEDGKKKTPKRRSGGGKRR